ncbi:hypothetical protein PUN28_002168 [Cardiocondyla obscurior]|uniref:Uncharacterized protein n=1 Tax=Cardiocondyla obscurior TaxID=286306 RepID=A0AAW2GSR8_9HYME
MRIKPFGPSLIVNGPRGVARLKLIVSPVLSCHRVCRSLEQAHGLTTRARRRLSPPHWYFSPFGPSSRIYGDRREEAEAVQPRYRDPPVHGGVPNRNL